MIDLVTKRCRAVYQHHKQRAAREGQALDYTAADLVEIARPNTPGVVQRCSYCRSLLAAADVSFDHRTPTSRQGGAHALRNLALCCSVCNEAKGKLTETEFRSLLAMMNDWHPVARQDVLKRLRAGLAARGRMFRNQKESNHE